MWFSYCDHKPVAKRLQILTSASISWCVIFFSGLFLNLGPNCKMYFAQFKFADCRQNCCFFVSFKSWPIMTVLTLMMPKFLFFRLRNRLQYSMAPTRLSSTIEKTPKCSKFKWTYEPPASVYTANVFWKIGRERKRKTNCTIITLSYIIYSSTIAFDQSAWTNRSVILERYVTLS